jgi:hypothetical protein
MPHRNRAREIGTEAERKVVEAATADGLDWDRGALRGTADLLDIQGGLRDGWLIGVKALTRKSKADDEKRTANLANRMSEGAAQCKRAMVNLRKLRADFADGVYPLQIVQKQGRPVLDWYAVFDVRAYFDLVHELRELRALRDHAERHAPELLAEITRVREEAAKRAHQETQRRAREAEERRAREKAEAERRAREEEMVSDGR